MNKVLLVTCPNRECVLPCEKWHFRHGGSARSASIADITHVAKFGREGGGAKRLGEGGKRYENVRGRSVAMTTCANIKGTLIRLYICFGEGPSLVHCSLGPHFSMLGCIQDACHNLLQGKWWPLMRWDCKCFHCFYSNPFWWPPPPSFAFRVAQNNLQIKTSWLDMDEVFNGESCSLFLVEPFAQCYSQSLSYPLKYS